MISTWRINALLKVAVLLPSISHGLASKKYPAPVGKLFEVAVIGGNVTDPVLSSRWLRYNSTSAALFGIPQPSDLGRISLFVDNG